MAPALVLENGLLDTSETPKHLVNMAQENFTSSLLLRTPPEVRGRIFQFAMGGLQVDIFATTKSPDSHARPKVLICDADPNCDEGEWTKATKTAFCLPQTCRQIYAETCTLAYSTNAFRFCGFQDYTTSMWLRGRLPAQVQAIVCLEIHLGDALLHGTRRVKDKHPKLKRLALTFPERGGLRSWVQDNGTSGIITETVAQQKLQGQLASDAFEVVLHPSTFHCWIYA
ncbi:hypothetical protein BU23DRAFT_603728 [Bimuria novae-zelandiae CBS 107.79]|uniref:DUF7730 domain-containing protein n=1 Tax=Bimuria novae-zelandiae CBS 107.79 TaxID=1447943 RepID=A0A6A5UTB5_9PLEO|nr:hypothetical protein BU23DRAFT_603728 [Bimuria novae-zelandiae CBS 107.79]